MRWSHAVSASEVDFGRCAQHSHNISTRRKDKGGGESNTEFSLNSHLEANALAFKGEYNPSFTDDGLVGTHYKGNITAINNLFLKNLCAKVSPE